MLHRENPEKQKQTLELMRAVVREGWGSDQDSYREFFTTQFIPDGSLDQHRWLNKVQRVAAAPEMAERYMCMNADMDVVNLLPKIRVPTLVMHARGDVRIPFSQGQELAAGIPGAKFVSLESRNHIILAKEPANRQFFDAIASFLGEPRIRVLPGTASFKERVEKVVLAVEQSWLIKIVVILAAITGVALFIEEMWRNLHK